MTSMRPIPFGKYILLEKISTGGMAEVFKAKSFGVQGFSKIIAIKRILPTMAEDDEFVTMFIDEARIAAQLNHSNICQIYELGKINKFHYIAMEYIHGKDLLELQRHFKDRGATMPIPMACYVMQQICEGLDYAHRKKDANMRSLNLVHRDVSPQNILVSFDGEVKIIDFGIAKATTRTTRTQVGVLKGKFGYMSPEQVRGVPLDHRSDIFAAGTVLYELVTGTRLFVGDSDFAILEKVRKAEIEPPSKRNPAVPPRLEAIILKALAREPTERYQWAREMAEDLARFIQEVAPDYSPKVIADWLREAYANELAKEREKLEFYSSITNPADFLKQVYGNDRPSQEVPRLDPSDENTTIFAYNEQNPIPMEGPTPEGGTPAESYQTPPLNTPLAIPAKRFHEEPANPEAPTPSEPMPAVSSGMQAWEAGPNEEDEDDDEDDGPTEAIQAISDEEYARIMHEASIKHEEVMGSGSAPFRGLQAPEAAGQGAGVSGKAADEDGGTMNLSVDELEVLDDGQVPVGQEEASAVGGGADTVRLDADDPAVLAALQEIGASPAGGAQAEGVRADDPEVMAAAKETAAKLQGESTVRLEADDPAVLDALRQAGAKLGDASTVRLDADDPAVLAALDDAAATVPSKPHVPQRTKRPVLKIAIGVLILVLLGVGAGYAAIHFDLRGRLTGLFKGSGSLLIVPAGPIRGDVKVLLDGEEISTSLPVTLEKVPAGNHVVTIRSKYHEPHEATVEIVEKALYEHRPSLPLKKEVWGTLRLHVQPGGPAEIWLDGERVARLAAGQEDVDVPILPEEDHELVVKKPGHLSKKVEVRLGLSESRDEFVELETFRGRLHLTSTPNHAWVYIDGRRVGRTPFKQDKLSPGKVYDVELRKHGYETWQEDVRFTGDEPAYVRHIELLKKGASEEPKEQRGGRVGYLTITAGVDVWAKVFVDGEDTGKRTPISSFSKLALAPGEHKITLELGGKTVEQTVAIEPGKVTRLKMRLK